MTTNPSTIATHPVICLTNLPAIVTNLATIVTYPATLVTNPVTFVTNPSIHSTNGDGLVMDLKRFLEKNAPLCTTRSQAPSGNALVEALLPH